MINFPELANGGTHGVRYASLSDKVRLRSVFFAEHLRNQKKTCFRVVGMRETDFFFAFFCEHNILHMFTLCQFSGGT